MPKVSYSVDLIHDTCKNNSQEDAYETCKKMYCDMCLFDEVFATVSAHVSSTRTTKALDLFIKQIKLIKSQDLNIKGMRIPHLIRIKLVGALRMRDNKKISPPTIIKQLYQYLYYMYIIKLQQMVAGLEEINFEIYWETPWYQNSTILSRKYKEFPDESNKDYRTGDLTPEEITLIEANWEEFVKVKYF